MSAMVDNDFHVKKPCRAILKVQKHYSAAL
jgi:hypothetical protein